MGQYASGTKRLKRRIVRWQDKTLEQFEKDIRLMVEELSNKKEIKYVRHKKRLSGSQPKSVLHRP